MLGRARDVARFAAHCATNCFAEAGLERDEVVAPFEDERDAPLGRALGDVVERLAHPPERGGAELHVRERIAKGRVEARAHEDELRRVRLDDRQGHALERAAVDGVASARGERHVDGEAAAFAFAVLVRRAGGGRGLGRRMEFRHAPCRKSHAGTLAGKCQTAGPPNSGARSGNERDSAANFQVHTSSALQPCAPLL